MTFLERLGVKKLIPDYEPRAMFAGSVNDRVLACGDAVYGTQLARISLHRIDS